jgi:dienelactone hydrolase
MTTIRVYLCSSVVINICLGALLFLANPVPGAPPDKGTVEFKPKDDQANIPKEFRLTEHKFDYEMTLKRDLPANRVRIFDLKFPSPVKSASPENNTVYAEYYVPHGAGPFPGVIVLDITGGDQSLSRTIAMTFAQSKIAALFVQMAYYGQRRPPGSKLRLLSTNFAQTVAAIRQTVLDLRRATAWLESRPEIDRQRLGLHGTSLGSLVGALAAEMEPKLQRVSLALGGGGLPGAYYDDERAAPYRKLWEAIGGTKEQAIKLLSVVDPLTYAENLKGRRVLMINAKRDEIIPPKCSVLLWEAAGKPKILWYDCTHYGAAIYFVPIMNQVVEHLKAE